MEEWMKVGGGKDQETMRFSRRKPEPGQKQDRSKPIVRQQGSKAGWTGIWPFGHLEEMV